MKTLSPLASLIIITAFSTITGCATTNTQPVTAQNDSTKYIPSLEVVIDCKGCEVGSNIPKLIKDEYKNSANSSYTQVSTDSKAIVTIVDYSARNDAARFLVGAFAGKDEIKAKVKYKDDTFIVEDYYRNAWQGIDSLAGKIGEMIYANMAKHSWDVKNSTTPIKPIIPTVK